MRILYFAPRQFWPVNTGAKIRDCHLARQLASQFDVTFLGFREGETDERVPEDVVAGFEQVITVPRGRGYTPLKLARGLVGRMPVTVLNYTTAAMKCKLAQLLEEKHFDVVQIESVQLAEYLTIVKRAICQPKIISDWHNIESELMLRYSHRHQNIAVRYYARATAARLAVLERRMLSECDAVCVPSQRERGVVLQTRPGPDAATVHVVGNGVDTAYYSDQALERAWLGSGLKKDGDGRRTLIYVGSMDYHANIDAVAWFAAEIWPLIHKAHPELVFRIVGRNPSKSVLALADRAGIEVTGDVQDVRPYYRAALAAMVPLRVGAGTRLKILEAMASATPVISTPLGAEGLAVQDGRNILLADTPREFLNAVNKIHESRSFRSELAENGRLLVRSKFDWEVIGAKLCDLHRQVGKVRSNLSEPESASL